MRLTGLPSFTMVAAIALAACEKPAPSAHPSVAPGALGIATGAIDTLTTLGSWLASHPGDVVGDSVPEGANREHLCRVATAVVDIGGRRFVRSALFNLPNPPAGEALPDTVHAVERLCHLRAIWLEAPERDSARAVALADSLARVLAAALGAIDPVLAMSAQATARWSDGRRWTGPGTTVVLGVRLPGPLYPGGSEMEGRVIVAAFAPHSGLDDRPRGTAAIDSDDEDDGERDEELARADSAIGWAGVPQIAAQLRPLMAQLRGMSDDAPHTAAFDSALARVALMVRDTSPLLAPARRAAALAATDIALNYALDDIYFSGHDYSSRLRATLLATHVPYSDDTLASNSYFSRPWIWEAYRLDSLGPAGHVAFISLLARGWTTKRGCADGTDDYMSVIEHGEAALKRGATDPLLHYYLGIAYGDIVSRPGSEHDRSTLPVPTVPEARARAIEHSRTALAGLTDRRLRRHAWRMATRLMLDRPDGFPRFYCATGD